MLTRVIRSSRTKSTETKSLYLIHATFEYWLISVHYYTVVLHNKCTCHYAGSSVWYKRPRSSHPPGGLNDDLSAGRKRPLCSCIEFFDSKSIAPNGRTESTESGAKTEVLATESIAGTSGLVCEVVLQSMYRLCGLYLVL